MRTIYVKNIKMQFSKAKFTQIDATWDKERYGMDFRQFIETNLFLDAKCFSKYKSPNGNGMDIENIEKLASLLDRPITDFLEPKPNKNVKETKQMTTNKTNSIILSDFTKKQIYDLYTALYECMIDFFATHAEDSIYELYMKLEIADVVIPEEILMFLWDTYFELSTLVENPDEFYASIPALSDNPTLEEIRARNHLIFELEDNWKEENLTPLTEFLKPYLIN